MHDLGAANVDAVDGVGFTALMAASLRGHLDSVKYLLEIKADTNVCSGKYGTAMHCAARNGHLEVLKVTLRQ